MAAVFAAVSSATVAPAFAISSADECNAAVNEVTRELLKANVSSEALANIDAAISAASSACQSADFAGAQSQITNARDLIKCSNQN